MSYKIEDMLNLRIPKNFGINEDTESSRAIETIFNQLDSSTHTAWGVTQFVINSDDWNEVVKIPFEGMYEWDEEKDVYIFNEFCWNYCEESVELYQKALEIGVAAIMAKTRVLGTNKIGQTIYAQEKVARPYANFKKHCSEDSFKLVKNSIKEKIYWCRFSTTWLGNAIDCYGFSFVDKFLKFCYDNDIVDLHDNNYGYRADGTPVIFDYASFSWGKAK